MNILQREWLRIRRSSVARNAGWMMAGQGAGIVLQAVYFLILARLLGAVQYGIFAGAFAFTIIVAPYSALGTGVVLLRYVSNDHRAFAVYWGNILVVTLSIGCVLCAALHFLAPHVLDPSSASLVLLAAIANCICMQIVSVAGNVFQAFEQLHLTALLNLLTNLVRTLTVLGLVLILHHASARQWALASTFVSALAAGIAMTVVTRKLGWPRFASQIILKHSAEGVGYSFAASTSFLYNDLDKTMLSHYGMNFANGIYTMAYRVIDMATIPINSIHAAALPQFFKRGASSLEEAAKFSHELIKRGFLLGFLATLGMFIAAPLIPHIAGQGFYESVSALRWLCLIPPLRSIHLMTGCALTGAGLQRYRTATQTGAVLLNFCLNLWLIPAYGWLGAAWSSLVTDGALAAMNWVVLRTIVISSERRLLSFPLKP
jgi:O-antigen/teichoic acid export membrane protein